MARPLFSDTVSAWDMGPVVGSLWYAEKHGKPTPTADLDEAAMNTIGYLVSRYGALSGTDLMHLSHSEEPWRRADVGRRPGTSVPIPATWMEEYLRAASAEDDVVFDAASVDAWLRGAERTRDAPGRRDDPAEIFRRIEDLKRSTGDRGHG